MSRPPCLYGLWLPIRAGLVGSAEEYLLEGVGVFQILADLVVARSALEALAYWADAHADVLMELERLPGIEVVGIRLQTPFDLEGSAPLAFRSYLAQALAEGATVPFYLGTEYDSIPVTLDRARGLHDRDL